MGRPADSRPGFYFEVKCKNIYQTPVLADYLLKAISKKPGYFGRSAIWLSAPIGDVVKGLPDTKVTVQLPAPVRQASLFERRSSSRSVLHGRASLTDSDETSFRECSVNEPLVGKKEEV